MDDPTTESELSALISKYGRCVVLGGIAGLVIAAVVLLLVPSPYRATAWVHLKGNDFERSAKGQLAVAEIPSEEFLSKLKDAPDIEPNDVAVRVSEKDAYLLISAKDAVATVAETVANTIANQWAAQQTDASPNFDVDLKNEIDQQKVEVARLAERHTTDHPMLKMAEERLAALEAEAVPPGSELIALKAEAERLPKPLLPAMFGGLLVGGFIGGLIRLRRKG